MNKLLSIPHNIFDVFKYLFCVDLLRFASIKNHQSKIVNICALLAVFSGNLFGNNTPHWTVNDNRYTNNMTMTAIVVKNGVKMRSDQVEIAAFSGNDCRGSAFLQYIAVQDRYLGFLMIFGEGGETITLKVYDHATGEEYSANNSPLIFIADVIHGNPNEPYPITFGKEMTFRSVTVNNGSGNGEFAEGDIVTIVANTPPAGQQFAGWQITPSVVFTSGSANSLTAKFIMPASAVTANATYEPVSAEKRLINVTTDGNGTANANVGSATAGTIITLTATPKSGYRFEKWEVVSGNVTLANATTNPVTFTMPDNPVEVKAIFELIPPTKYTVMFFVAGGNGNLSATVDGTAITSGVSVEAGKSVVFTATPSTSNVVKEWRRDGTVITGNTSDVYTLSNLSAHATITVVFDAIPTDHHPINVSTDGNGIASANVGSAKAGTTITITATPKSGYRFVKWEVVNGGVTLANTTTNPTTFTMPDNPVEVKAIFELISVITHTVTFSVANGNGIIVARSGGINIISGASIEEGKDIIFSASPTTDFRVKYWALNSVKITDNTTDTYVLFNLKSDAKVTVEFEPFTLLLDFDMYVATKWNNNTFMLDLNRLQADGYMVTGCKWYKNTDEFLSEGYIYSAGVQRKDRLESSFYRFELTTSNRGVLHSTEKAIDVKYIATSLKAYPNPVSSGSTLTIADVDEGSRIEVFNQSGLCVSRTIATNSPATLTLNLSAGVYVVRTNNGEIKIVIEK